MFDSPSLIKGIPDIEQIYEINETQGERLDTDLEQLDADMFFDTMSEETTEHWEDFLDLAPAADDNLTTRRFRVKTKATERLPYSVRVFRKRLNDLFGAGNYELTFSDELDHIHLKFGLEYAKAIQDAIELIETITPLNMTYEVEASSERTVKSGVYHVGIIKTIKFEGLKNDTEYSHTVESELHGGGSIKTFKTKEVTNGHIISN